MGAKIVKALAIVAMRADQYCTVSVDGVRDDERGPVHGVYFF